MEAVSIVEVVEVCLSAAANVRLLDSSNYNNYKNGRHHRYYGGYVKKSPYRIIVPNSGHWYITIDLGGYSGTVKHSVQVLPGVLPAARTRIPLANEPNLYVEAPEANKDYDVFISHASEDKEAVVRPLANALKEKGLNVWYIRDEQIVEDVKNCVSAGRTPVVLSRYKDHSEKLYERLKDYADHVFLMTGNNSKKEHKKILEQMHQVYKAESLILIATGSLVGEGFDFPRLDTLFMATPVSFRGVVEQYAGRLNRDYAGKENVIIYDYVDNHITMFNNMYMKRLKAYKQIGYEIAGGLHNDKQTANAIYDGDNYAENYHKDLLDANKNIIISSPAISGTKVYELINLLKEKQLSGVQITIVTWAPDSYGFGDASYWMQLHEEMRKAGFYIKTVEESCERFAVIDQEVVWYGNINLLAKDKVDDSIMRVLSKEIASELMEITFGDNG